MEQTPKQQAIELIHLAKNILVVTHKNPDGDALGSLVALKISLEKLGKKVSIACPDRPIGLFSFLPKMNEIKTHVDVSKDLVISLDTRNAQIEKIGYKKDEEANRINIVIVPRDGKFEESDVKIKKAGPLYDLIIVVDTPNFERLGKLALPTDIFYEVPVINIDHHPSNERYGKVNWIELVSTSTAEILVSLLEALSREAPLIDKEVATALLTGLIYDTSSFQNVNTTPKSLTVAAQLVASGARQQEIIKNLYKTKSLETLKLWGLVLSNVKEDKTNRFLWSSVSREDIDRSGSDEGALSGVVDELLKTATNVDFAMLLSERDNQVHGSLRSIAKGVNVAQIAEIFAGGGHEAASAFRVDGRLNDKEEEILSKIRQHQNGLGNSALSQGQSVSKTLPNVEPSPFKSEPKEEKIEEAVDEVKKDVPEEIEGTTDDNENVEKSESEKELPERNELTETLEMKTANEPEATKNPQSEKQPDEADRERKTKW